MSLAQAITWKTNQRGTAARLRRAVRDLLVSVDGITCTQLRLAGGMERVSTTVQVHGNGHTGRGEDVAYAGDTQQLLPAAFAQITPLISGEWKLGELSDKLDAQFALDLPPGSMEDDKPGYHRWAIDAALLDLALRQSQTNLAQLVGAEWSPVRVSLSMGVDGSEGIAKLRSWVQRDPSISFKIDTSMDWDAELVAALATIGDGRAVATIDFKALYHGEWINNDYPASLYASVANHLPAALLEDAKLTADNQAHLGVDGCERLSWDFPITAPHDVPGLTDSTAEFSELRPAAINIKPSRFGSLDRVLATIELCDAHEIPCYAGGQYELGIGRTQVQTIASLCFADAPNDCAPVMFHGAAPDAPDVPLGAVVVPAQQHGFGWDAPTRAEAI